jgi:hypothetical protein
LPIQKIKIDKSIISDMAVIPDKGQYFGSYFGSYFAVIQTVKNPNRAKYPDTS